MYAYLRSLLDVSGSVNAFNVFESFRVLFEPGWKVRIAREKIQP